MLTVNFFKLGEVQEEKLDYAVMISRFNGRFLYVKHRKRETWELPGGKRESDETIYECAARELREETGATNFKLKPLFIYSVTKSKFTDYGQVYLAEILVKKDQLINEIGEASSFTQPPKEWTYPEIQPLILNHYLKLTHFSD